MKRYLKSMNDTCVAMGKQCLTMLNSFMAQQPQSQMISGHRPSVNLANITTLSEFSDYEGIASILPLQLNCCPIVNDKNVFEYSNGILHGNTMNVSLNVNINYVRYVLLKSNRSIKDYQTSGAKRETEILENLFQVCVDEWKHRTYFVTLQPCDNPTKFYDSVVHCRYPHGNGILLEVVKDSQSEVKEDDMLSIYADDTCHHVLFRCQLHELRTFVIDRPEVWLSVTGKSSIAVSLSPVPHVLSLLVNPTLQTAWNWTLPSLYAVFRVCVNFVFFLLLLFCLF